MDVVRSSLPPNKNHLLMKELSSDRVSVTGSHSDMSVILQHAERDDDAETKTETLEAIRFDNGSKSNPSQDQQGDSSQSASLKGPRRRRRILAEPNLQHPDT